MAPLLINVAFVTLLERKILAGAQIRLGPNKVGFRGFLQPFADVVKLFAAQVSLLTYNLKLAYILRPLVSLLLSLIFLNNIPIIHGQREWKFNFLLLLILLSFNVYPLLLRGWSSNRGYGHLGALRSAAQTISYEISLAFVILRIFSLTFYLSFNQMRTNVSFSKILFLPILVLWLVRAIAELNRTPFDFSEGESELVSGFNIEYRATKFALFFIAEYLIILMLRVITRIFFVQKRFSWGSVIILSLFFTSLVLWARASYPRFRYDKLINIAWKSLLPIRLRLAQLRLLLNLFFY